MALTFRGEFECTKQCPLQTSEPRPEPVVVSVEEPVQDPGKNCAVVVGGCLLLSLGGLAKTRRRGNEEAMRRNTIQALVKAQDVKPDTVIVIN